MENNKTVRTMIIQEENENGFAVAGLVLGILGVVLNLIPGLPYILGLLAIIFGLTGLFAPVKKGMSVSAVILGVITISLKILFWVGFSTFFF